MHLKLLHRSFPIAPLLSFLKGLVKGIEAYGIIKSRHKVKPELAALPPVGECVFGVCSSVAQQEKASFPFACPRMACRALRLDAGFGNRANANPRNRRVVVVGIAIAVDIREVRCVRDSRQPPVRAAVSGLSLNSLKVFVVGFSPTLQQPVFRLALLQPRLEFADRNPGA